MGKSSQKSATEAKEVPTMFLDDLEEGSHGPITVMVCRKWDMNNINGRYMSTYFIVSDKKGNVMHCIAKSNISHYFIGKLQEGGLYSLRDFSVQPNRDTYRILKDSDYIIELQGSTIVTKATDSLDGFVRHPFHLVAYEDLKPTDGRYFVDVVGYIAALGKPSKKPNGAQTLDFSLVNQRGRQVRVTLWGTLGDDLIKKKGQKDDIYAVILTSMSAKYYLEHLCLSSSSSTLIIDDAAVPALQEFTAALSGADIDGASLPMMQKQEKLETISDLLQWARNTKHDVAAFRNTVEIIKIRTKNSWFNFTCNSGKCRKGVSRKNGNFWCDACETSVPFPRPRFRLQLDIQDDSGHAVVVLFDETAEKLVRKTAKALLDEQNADDTEDASVLPQALENLIGTSHIFEIKSTTYYQYGDFESFNCSQVVLPEIDSQPFEAGTSIKSDHGKGLQSSPPNALKRISPISTPAKKTEPKKRKLHIEDLESDIPPKTNVGKIESSKRPHKSNRRIEDSESDGDIEDPLTVKHINKHQG